MNNYWTTTVRIKVVACYQQVMPKCPASSWHGMQEFEPHPHIELLRGPPVRSTSEMSIVASRFVCVHESQVKVSVLAIL